MEAAFRYRMATRLARRLREAGRPFPSLPWGRPWGFAAPWSGWCGPFWTGGSSWRRGWGFGSGATPFPWREAVVVLDLETTGLAPGLDEVIEVGLLRLEGEAPPLPEPRPPLPPAEPLRGAPHRHPPGGPGGGPSLEEVLEKAYPLLADATLVIHNAAFDLGFLRPALEGLGYRLENPVVDSLRLARRGLPGLRRYGLDALSEVLELPRRTCHRALEDVERTLAVVHEVYYMLTSGRPRTLWELGR